MKRMGCAMPRREFDKLRPGRFRRNGTEEIEELSIVDERKE